MWSKGGLKGLGNLILSVTSWILAISNQIFLYTFRITQACNKLAGPISASLRPGNTASFEEMSQRWQAVDNSVFDLTGPRFEP